MPVYYQRCDPTSELISNNILPQMIRNKARMIKPSKQMSSLSCPRKFSWSLFDQTKESLKSTILLYDSLSNLFGIPLDDLFWLRWSEWNTASYTFSPNVASYWLGIVSCIGQNLFRSGFWPSSACIDSYAADDLLESMAILLMPGLMVIARGNESELKAA